MNQAILVGVEIKSRETPQWTIEHSLEELSELARTAGVKVIERLTQAREKPDPRTYIGKGKVAELKAIIEETDATIVLTDDELTPAQSKNLEKELNVKILDRTGLILDIFASRAQTAEAQLQVELAQLEYMMPRLTNMWTHLSRMGGGIGTKGPGEKQLETDKRLVRKRITLIKKKLEQVQQSRDLRRKKRKEVPVICGALTGYTNAGKSTILNQLTNAEVLAEDKLFATLDPTSRRFQLPTNQETVLTDTVGFLQKLPHQLVKAFYSTLEEVTEADYLVHVCDVSHPNLEGMLDTTKSIIKSLKADNIPMVYVFNKIDKVAKPNQVKKSLDQYEPKIFISALDKDGIDQLIVAINDLLESYQEDMSFNVPYNKMDIVHMIHQYGNVNDIKYDNDFIRIQATINRLKGERLLNQLYSHSK
ncbi:GTPase HflX [Candidatus Marinamargulisbacteria bacterium SCGC AAA071-K20]|nr:GTPase HflX [Candidatus Marinamargulisbacteria bacterium SCGC AAA071-K20]